MKIIGDVTSRILACSLLFMLPFAASGADSTAQESSVSADTQSLDDTATTADSLSQGANLLPSKKADTLSADSAKKAARRDSLMAEKSKAMASYQTFPVSLDSLRHPIHLRRQAIFSSDAFTISDLARKFPQMVAAPFSLSNNLNRFMVYGFPLPGPLMDADEGIFFTAADAFTGTDRTASTQVSGLSIDPLQRLRLTPHLDDCVVPETDMLWENGVFFENILNIRFVRPLSSDLYFGVFSNNRYFKAENYFTRNDIKSLYGYFVTDTNLLVQSGKNPLVEDQNTELRFAAKGKNGERQNLSLSYHDEKNEISYQSIDSGHTALRWDRIFQYGTIVNGGFEGMKLSRLFLDAQLHVESGGHNRYNPYAFMQRQGRNNDYALALRPYFPFKNDTAFFVAGCTRYDETVYDQSRRTAYREDASVMGTHHSSIFGADAAVSGSIGQSFLYLKKLSIKKNDWTGALTAKIEATHHMLRAFAMRGCAPFPPLYDSTSALTSPFFKMYEMYGAECFTTYKKIGLMAGICGVSGQNGYDSAYVWPENVLPYRQPRVSYMLSPLFGQWHGLSAASRWMFSDTKPFIKVQTNISYIAHPLDGKEHILLDLVYDYWSTRDTLTYGGVSDWNREINNLSLKVAVQIKTFSLFYKVDNILNRSFAYVPGYRMPGLTFRWGFQWLIQG